jgi:hypothetical protein
MSDGNEDFFDLDAAAAETRAQRKPWKVRFGGDMWHMANAFNLDLDLLERAEAGDIGAIREALKMGLGDQYAGFRAKGLDLAALTALFNNWVAASGSTPGESVASSASSGSTGRPSKRTSKGSTGSGSGKRSTANRASAAPPAN